MRPDMVAAGMAAVLVLLAGCGGPKGMKDITLHVEGMTKRLNLF